ncbi:protein-tyrosine phosphatase family protein [Thermus hydrothermalis]|uniref:protein-tyrosine phosphatase family protein n=1 Tax=Thermus hydrothermalis TaxID=2908148 RepID=UPI003C12B8F3
MGGLRAIVVEWPDYGVPSFVTRSHWEVLANYLREKVGRLYVGCDGGLGRTGTTLAILAGLWRLTDSPVTFVRERYDPHAVETPEQEAYVTSMMPPGR